MRFFTVTCALALARACAHDAEVELTNPMHNFSAPPANEFTELTNALNALIKTGTKGVYTGGTGVLVRNPFDGYANDTTKTVVPATLWVNDIVGISQLYPSFGNPEHPTKGAENDDPWQYPNLAFVIGSAMQNVMGPEWANVQDDDWGYGVFYPYDSNSVDQRCRWKPDLQIYDCPGGFIGESYYGSKNAMGAGGYPMGNPVANNENGGGAGCHYYTTKHTLDQLNGDNGKRKLVGNQMCECNYDFKNPFAYDPTENGWGAWVDQFKMNAIPESGDPGASWNGDLAMCWVNNVRDMINLQNQLFWKRTWWSSESLPNADYFNLGNFAWTRRYWGWNEIPVTRTAVQDTSNWDAVVIQVPAFACQGKNWDNLDCLNDLQQYVLDDVLDDWVRAGYLQIGRNAASRRPGSSVVLARQNNVNGNFHIQFFCTSWTSPSGGRYKIVHDPVSVENAHGGCWLDVNPSSDAVQSQPVPLPQNQDHVQQNQAAILGQEPGSIRDMFASVESNPTVMV